MANYITVDGGTTNTRISLVNDGKIADTLFFPVGAGAGEEGKARLRDTVKEGVREILGRNNIEETDIRRILASGMITSEFGLCTLPHLVVPAGIAELKQGSEETVLEDISSVPFVFVRGVKTECTSPEKADMMRGEETELMGIQEENGPCVYMLMGSHTKIIRTDADGRIADIYTTLTGELLAAAAEHTILKNAISLKGASIVSEFLRQGYEYGEKTGLAEALFKVRILRNLFGTAPDEAYSFCLGAVLKDDIGCFRRTGTGKVVVGGNKRLRDAAAILLASYTDAAVTVLSDADVDASVSRGLIRVYEHGMQ